MSNEMDPDRFLILGEKLQTSEQNSLKNWVLTFAISGVKNKPMPVIIFAFFWYVVVWITWTNLLLIFMKHIPSVSVKNIYI